MGKYADALMGGEPAPEQTGAGKYSSQLLDSPPMAQSAPVEAKPEGWGDWIKNSIRGRQDPKEAGTGTVYEQFTPELKSPTATAAMAGAGDEGMADIISKTLGDKFVRREADANGYPIIVSRGQDGQEQRGYVNKPGLDTQDVWRGFYGAAPYAVTGGIAGTALKGAGVGVNALAQGGAAAATSLAGDVGSGMQGSEQGVDITKAGVNAALGAAGPVAGMAAGALWRKFVTVPGLFDEAAGTLTAKGIEAAKRAGIDPADVTVDFAKSFATNLAKTGDEAAAATRAGVGRFGIPATKGQVTKDPYLLTQEEGMRRRLYGESAQDTMRGFDAKQQEAVRFAALGDDGSGAGGYGSFRAPKQGIAETLNPGRKPGQFPSDRAAADLGTGAKFGLETAKANSKAQETALWKGVDDLKATPDAMAGLPEKLNSVLADETALTPSARAMDEALSGYIKGDTPVSAGSVLKTGKPDSVDAMRRHLGGIYEDAAPGSNDARQAKKIYSAFVDWIGESAEKQLLAGNPEAAMNMVKARGFHREAMAVFKPKGADGKPSAAASRLGKVLNADSGEAVVEALFGAQGSKISAGSVEALSNIRAALNRYAPEVAEQSWNDIRLAHWSRLVTGKNGELVGPQAMANNLKEAMASSKSVFEQLYKPAEQRQIKEFVRALDVITYKPPNASGSGYAAASFAKEGVKRLLDAFGVGKIADTALQFSGVGKALNSAAARQAVQQMARPVRPNVTPAITGMGNALYNGQDSGGR